MIAGRYTLERVLGRGGMAVVYYAFDGKLDRPVALKLLAEHLIEDHTFRKRLLHEARVAARLSHPSIVQVYDAGEEGDRPYIVMEYVEGETLAAILQQRHRLPPDEVVELALQICDGLAYAHAAGLVHRDIKPQNLLLTPAGDVKIADFGIARAEGGTRATETGTILGTAGYLPPEQAAGKDATPTADLYSLGVVLYELVGGEQPYRFSSLPELLALQQTQAIRPLRQLAAEVPPALEHAVLRCLATDPRAGRSRPGNSPASCLKPVPAKPGCCPLRAANLRKSSPNMLIPLRPGRSRSHGGADAQPLVERSREAGAS